MTFWKKALEHVKLSERLPFVKIPNSFIVHWKTWCIVAFAKTFIVVCFLCINYT